jgi:hypothetical protein
MNQETIQEINYTYLRSKRETCLKCDQRNQCSRPIKDTEDEDTAKYACDKYKVVK